MSDALISSISHVKEQIVYYPAYQETKSEAENLGLHS
jgi:hypothetical protein